MFLRVRGTNASADGCPLPTAKFH